VTPKINPDGSVIMRVVPIVSSVSNTTVQITEGTFASAFDIQTVETTIIAQDGETVVLGGLIARRNEKDENKIPWLGDLPGVGALFRYRNQRKRKTELLVILTPQIVRCRADADQILHEQSGKMSWMMPDVLRTYGIHGMEPIMPGFVPPPPGYMRPPLVPGSPYLPYTTHPPAPPYGPAFPVLPALPGSGLEVLPNPAPKGAPTMPPAPQASAAGKSPDWPQPVIHNDVPIFNVPKGSEPMKSPAAKHNMADKRAVPAQATHLPPVQNKSQPSFHDPQPAGLPGATHSQPHGPALNQQGAPGPTGAPNYRQPTGGAPLLQPTGFNGAPAVAPNYPAAPGQPPFPIVGQGQGTDPAN
jgi:hypothetical protein